MMPSSTSESWARICDCWCDGKTSMMRLMVEDAELVCNVPKVRWPVSAIRSADSMVSRSRISPIRTTSGSSRSAARSASVKLFVSECNSRWLTRQFLFMCTNSIGSSMVRMWSWRSVLILSIIDASVVDLPDPVGPVTSTSPRGLSHILLTTAGRPNWWKDLISNGIRRKTQAEAPRWLKTLARKRARPFSPNEKSSSRVSSKRCFCESVITLYASCLVSAGVSCGRSSGTRCPCTRIWGGELVVIWRSLPPISNMRRSRSLSESAIIFFSSLAPFLVDRFASHFFERGPALRDLGQPAAAQGDHAAFNRFFLKFNRRGADQNQFPDLVIHLHHFVQTGAAFVACLVAGSAAFALHDLHRLGLFRTEPFIDQ